MKVILINLGCPKNQLDGEICLASFLENGFELAQQPEEAEVVIVNTCGFIDDAKKESISTILTAAKLKENGRCKSLIVTGCLSQLYHNDLKKELPEVDIFLGVSTYKDAYSVFAKNEKKPVRAFIEKPGYVHKLCSHIDTLQKNEYISEIGRYSSYVKISEGCNNCCTYCVIPKIRGPLIKRDIKEVVSEISYLVSKGAREIILIAQDLTADPVMLKNILKGISSLTSTDRPEWLRLMYCNPDGIDKELVEIIRNEEFICNYIDMPVQHVSDAILTKMGRRARQKQVIQSLDLLSSYSDISIRSSVMVGFPGETDMDFEELRNLVSEGIFYWLGIFIYSPQKGTLAFNLPKKVSKKKALERRNELDRIQFDITNSFNKAYIGREIDVLFHGTDEDGLVFGHSRFQAPVVDGIVKCNSKCGMGIAKVLIEDAVGWDLYARIRE